ncbi:hypothetical protein TIFTF001_002337 [Ficus carica]|uniref:Serine protease EDA2 n=1 Tax=Ficus carica TaxID=3494 RepID=A0AA87Z4C9_FICCA|nr:hypothetical protein TIFTF001_002337 [Ficus carica]
MRLQNWKTTSVSLLPLVISSLFSSYGFFVNGMPPRSMFNRLAGSSNYLTTDELWFSQNLDHFSPYDHRQFQQRYYEFLENFRIPDGPIFLNICGEGPCNGIQNDYLSILSKKFGAAVVSLEHRYYGKSSPFKSLTTENLKYLSSKQALFDLAESLNKKLNRTNVENPWFFFGVSYSGALSAWFRLKFPHLTCGSLASSAVVLAVYDFPEFDQQIGVSAGPECKAALQEVTRLVEERLAKEGKSVKALFGAAELEIDGDFFYFLADAAVIGFQYGNPDTVCSPLVEAKKNGEDLVGAFAKYVKEYYIGSFGTNVRTYDQRYHLDLCRNVFGEGIYPEVDVTNLYYGGTKIGVPSYIITCHNCGHGTDLRGCPQSPLSLEGNAEKCSSPDAVKKVRQQIIENIDLWLSQCHDAEKNYIYYLLNGCFKVNP